MLKNIKRLSSTILAIVMLAGCSPSVAPAKFEVTSLVINPSQITAGESSTVTAIITNTGGTSGIYNAVLTIDAVRSDAKSVQLAPGADQTVKFSITIPTAGNYRIQVGGMDAILIVKPKLTPMPAEIKYDGGFARDYLGLDKPATGYLVSFKPPSQSFVIKKIQVRGLIYGGRGAQIKDLEIQIWDRNRKSVYNAMLPGTKFPQISFLLSDIENKGEWVDLDVPDIKVEGDFYVHIYTGYSTGQGFRMGVDDSVPNAHSDITVRDDKGMDNPIPVWPYPSSKWFGDKSRVNWMVRVAGNALVPQ